MFHLHRWEKFPQPHRNHAASAALFKPLPILKLARRRSQMKQLNRSLFFVAMAVLVGLAIAVPCSHAGPTLYQTGFERPEFWPGKLVGQEGWIGLPPLSPNAAVISTDKPRQGKQSVLVPGKDLVPLDVINTGNQWVLQCHWLLSAAIEPRLMTPEARRQCASRPTCGWTAHIPPVTITSSRPA